jgi:hypothetical protein
MKSLENVMAWKIIYWHHKTTTYSTEVTGNRKV